MILLHCLWAKSNNRTRGQFECDVSGFAFVLISFVHMHGEVVVSLFVGEGGRALRLKLDIQGPESGAALDAYGQMGVLNIRQLSWTSYVYRP